MYKAKTAVETNIGRSAMALLMVLSVCVSTALGRQVQETGGRVEGVVIVRDSGGNLSSVRGVKVRLSGPVTIETETDEQGRYTFMGVHLGSYVIQASSPGIEVTRTLTVEADKVAALELELRPTEVRHSVTVTASRPEDKEASPSEAVNEKTLQDAPNSNERFESALPLIPGVVRGPDGHINLKGARTTQGGALVNSANVTDPATGNPAINLPIDVVSSVQVISNPYDPQYGKLAGAVSTVDTKTSNYEKFHFSVQNLLPRLRDRNGSIVGIGATTPRVTFTRPIVKRRFAFTQSFEYRFVRTPVNSLPPLERDTKLESLDSFTQFDLVINPKQTATVSFALYPQKLDYFGLNTFTPQPSTPDFHQRGYQVYVQHRYLGGGQSILTSQFSYKRFDADVTAQSDDPYRLLPDTTEGGFFNRQARRTSRSEWQENYQFAPRQFLGSHQFKVGLNYARSAYEGSQAFLPAEIADASDTVIERITFTQPTVFDIDQNETAWYAADQWSVLPRLTVSLGARLGGRIALVADVEVAGQTLATFNVHLESKEDDALRLQQLSEVLAEMTTRVSNKPTLIAGDLNLNASEGQAAVVLKEAGFRDAVGLPDVRTRPARGVFDQGRSIDWIFIAGHLKSSKGQVHNSVRASDHFPLSFVLALS